MRLEDESVLKVGVTMKSLLMASAVLTAAPSLAATKAAPATAAKAELPFLLQPWTGPHGGVPPWDKVQPEQFPPAFEVAFADLRAEIRTIADNKAAPTFDNVIGALESSGQQLDQVSTMFDLMTSNMNSTAYQALDREWSPKFAALYDEISMDPKLFARSDALYQKRGSLKLNAMQLRLLERTHDRFVRSGAKLSTPIASSTALAASRAGTSVPAAPVRISTFRPRR